MIATTLHIDGDVDLARARSLEESLLAARSAGDIVVDLSAVSFIDSTGLDALMDRAAPTPSLAIAQHSAPVARLLEATQAAGLVELRGGSLGTCLVTWTIDGGRV